VGFFFRCPCLFGHEHTYRKTHSLSLKKKLTSPPAVRNAHMAYMNGLFCSIWLNLTNKPFCKFSHVKDVLVHVSKPESLACFFLCLCFFENRFFAFQLTVLFMSKTNKNVTAVVNAIKILSRPAFRLTNLSITLFVSTRTAIGFRCPKLKKKLRKFLPSIEN
jgi:hypothetical protein